MRIYIIQSFLNLFIFIFFINKKSTINVKSDHLLIFHYYLFYPRNHKSGKEN
jgi:hypothetical protein